MSSLDWLSTAIPVGALTLAVLLAIVATERVAQFGELVKVHRNS
jgi:hypothetical protein